MRRRSLVVSSLGNVPLVCLFVPFSCIMICDSARQERTRLETEVPRFDFGSALLLGLLQQCDITPQQLAACVQHTQPFNFVTGVAVGSDKTSEWWDVWW